MDNTPATALGRVRRHIQIFLQKSRLYLEQDFVEPITATTMDEVQLFTAGSALQRIHDSAPNSQQSGALQSLETEGTYTVGIALNLATIQGLAYANPCQALAFSAIPTVYVPSACSGLSVWQVAGRATLRVPPLFDLPPWVLDRCGDEEYLSQLTPSTLVALV